MVTKGKVINALKDPLKAGKKLIKLLFERRVKFPSNQGYCVICKSNTTFIEYDTWLRDHYLCMRCKTIPRQRALIAVLNLHYPNWRRMKIHESSPGADFIKKECLDYSASQFYPGKLAGERIGEFTNEDLTKLTFQDECFDLFITQDVFEHVLQPDLAFSEIARVIKPGGAHIFTMPWYPELQTTRIRAEAIGGEIKLLEVAEFHGNPVSEKGSLVTRDWGIDFTDFIFKHGSLMTTIHLVRDRSLGIDGKFLEVFISRKSS